MNGGELATCARTAARCAGVSGPVKRSIARARVFSRRASRCAGVRSTNSCQSFRPRGEVREQLVTWAALNVRASAV